MTFGKSQEGKPQPELYPLLPHLLLIINLKFGSRALKIAYTILYETALPMILLNEEWIKEAGLEIGESLIVQIEPKRLIITPEGKEVIP